MIVLGIDTSTMTGGAALIGDEGLIGEYTLNIRSTHSERLLPAVQQILNDAELTLSDVDGIGVVTGPGSFTGLRIGVASAKGFAYALSIPVVGVTSLACYAWQFAYFAGLVIPLIDARRQEVFTQVFQGLTPITEELNLPIADLLAKLATADQPLLFVGDGAQVYRKEVAKELPQAQFPSLEAATLATRSVAGYSRRQLASGMQEDVFALTPLYMRKSEAEIKWEAKHKAE